MALAATLFCFTIKYPLYHIQGINGCKYDADSANSSHPYTKTEKSVEHHHEFPNKMHWLKARMFASASTTKEPQVQEPQRANPPNSTNLRVPSWTWRPSATIHKPIMLIPWFEHLNHYPCKPVLLIGKYRRAPSTNVCDGGVSDEPFFISSCLMAISDAYSIPITDSTIIRLTKMSWCDWHHPAGAILKRHTNPSLPLQHQNHKAAVGDCSYVSVARCEREIPAFNKECNKEQYKRKILFRRRLILVCKKKIKQKRMIRVLKYRYNIPEPTSTKNNKCVDEEF